MILIVLTLLSLVISILLIRQAVIDARDVDFDEMTGDEYLAYRNALKSEQKRTRILHRVTSKLKR